MTGPGSFAELNAGDGTQKNWFEQAAGRGSSWVAAAQDLADATSPPEIAVATVTSRAEILQAVASPGKALVNNGLGFLVALATSWAVEIVEWAIGDPEQMRATAVGWGKVATWLDQVADAERRRAAATEAVWVGAAASAFRSQMNSFATAVEDLADDIRELKEGLETLADLFDMLVEFVIATLTELVIGLIVQWLAALAATWVTGGISNGAAMAVTYTRVGRAVVKVGTKVSSTQQKIGALVVKLEGLLQKLRGSRGLRQVLDKMEEMRNGGVFKSFIAGCVDRSSRVGRIVTNADYGKVVNGVVQPGSLASKVSNHFMEATGPTALASNISEAILGSMVGGSASLGRAMAKAGTAVGTDFAIEKGAEMIYDKATADPKRSKDERIANQVRGFGLDQQGGTA